MRPHRHRSSWSLFGAGLLTGLSVVFGARAYRRVMDEEVLSAFGCQ